MLHAKDLCLACSFSVLFLSALPTAVLAQRVSVRGNIRLPGVDVQIGADRPFRHYHHRGGRSSIYLGPVLYPPVVVYAPPVVYTARQVVYSAPPVVQSPPQHATATLRILVAPLLADMYLDGQYIGRAQEFPDGQVQLVVSAGNYTVELRVGTIAHTHTFYVSPGATMVVNDRLT